MSSQIRLLPPEESQRRSNSLHLRHNVGAAQPGVIIHLGSKEAGRVFSGGGGQLVPGHQLPSTSRRAPWANAEHDRENQFMFMNQRQSLCIVGGISG